MTVDVRVIGQMDNSVDHTFESANRVYDKAGLCPTLPTCAGGGIQPKVIDAVNGAVRGRGEGWKQTLELKSDGTANTLTSVQKDNVVMEKEKTEYRIRKLTPRETWRLMNFKDSDFDKAAYKTNIFYLEGDREKCNAKLRIVPEKQKLSNTATYALCTTSDLCDMEILETIKKSLAKKQENEKMQNVNFAIERLEKMGHSECAINITKCITFMGMQCTLTEEKDQNHTVIIVQAEKDKENTERCMRITTESNLEESKLYIILILTKQIMQLKIFGSTILRVNICGRTDIMKSCENNMMLKILNLKMEVISQNVSSSQLYKESGNAIVRAVLMAIFSQMNIKGVKPWNKMTTEEKEMLVNKDII